MSFFRALSFLSVYLQAHDSDQIPHREADESVHIAVRFQSELMTYVVDIGEFYRRDPKRDKITMRERIDSVCTWEGVSCIDGLVHRIKWLTTPYPVISLEYFPPTLSTVIIDQSTGHSKTLTTRRLPQLLQHCFFHNANIQGTVDMSNLPRGMRVFSVPYNSLKGVVELTKLPEAIQRIDMRHTFLTKVIYDATLLPKTLEDARFYHLKKCIRIVSINGTDDSRIINDRRQPVKAILTKY